MAIFRFKRLTESKKSALILVKANKFQTNWSPAYVPAEAVAGMNEDEEGTLPDGYSLVPIVDAETGEVRTAKDGSPLHTLCWK